MIEMHNLKLGGEGAGVKTIACREVNPFGTDRGGLEACQNPNMLGQISRFDAVDESVRCLF